MSACFGCRGSERLTERDRKRDGVGQRGGGSEKERGRERRESGRERSGGGKNLFHVHVCAQVKISSLYWDNLSVDTELNSLSSSMYAQVCESQ